MPMRFWSSRLFSPFLLGFLLLSPPGTLAQDIERMDEIVRAQSDGLRFMGSVLVAKDGETLFERSYGYANLEWDIPNTRDTKFRIGSITKQFTAAAILLLEERGRLDLDDKVGKHMPDAQAAWDDVTVFHLLTHTSGIPSFTGFPEYRTMKLSPSPVAETVAAFRDLPLQFEPGERMVYSNSGYVLLGYLIEQISGQGYEDFLRENVFTPLGMEGTGLDSNSAILPKRAAGYSPRADGPRNAEFIHMSIPHGAGALYSTTVDLARWTEALFAGEVLSPESLDRMTTPFKDGYGLGVEVTEVDGHDVVQHGGGIEGFNTHLAYYPEEALTVVVLGNVAGNAPAQIARLLGAHALGEPVVLPLALHQGSREMRAPRVAGRVEISVPNDVLARYVGTYELDPGFLLAITLEDGRLMSQATGQGKAELYAEAPNVFFLKVADAEVEFVDGDGGEVEALILRQGGETFRAPRL